MPPSIIQATVPVAADNRLWSGSPTTNYGNLISIQIAAIAPGDISRGILSFDLEPYAQRRAAMATLGLFATGPVYPSVAYCLALMDETWAELASCWDDKDAGTPWRGPAGGGNLEAGYEQTFIRPPASGPFEIAGVGSTDLCGMVNRRLGGRLDLLMRREDESGMAGTFDVLSRDFFIPTHRPYLLIAFAAYEILLKVGSPPIVGVDEPVAISADATIDLAEADLDLAADSIYHVAIAPFNASGYAEQAERFTFRTDGDGHPYTVPSPVHSLTVDPRTGGKAMIRWQYDELESWATADSFVITFEPLAGQRPDQSPVIGRSEPAARSYAHEATVVTDGPWRVRVLAFRDGKAELNVSGVDVMIDSNPPAAVTLPGMTAV